MSMQEYLDSIHRVEYLSSDTMLLTKVNGEPLEIVSPNTLESSRRIRAHIPTPVALGTAVIVVPFGSIDDNPSNIVYSGGATRDFTINEDGQYDVIVNAIASSATNIKSILIVRTLAAGGSEFIGGGVAPVGYTVFSALAMDQTFLEGDKIYLWANVSAGTQNLNACRLSIVKRGDPFV